MAEFQNVIEEAKRMCWHYMQKGSHNGCPMYPACNISQCRKIAFERPAEFEERVMAWAAEHPESVYPSWKEYFVKVYGSGLFGEPLMAIQKLCEEPIPADIAEKLGIEPKEG